MAKKINGNSLYRRIIIHALELAWGHKHLWIFGLFSAFIGFGGIADVFFQAWQKSASTPLVASGSFLQLVPNIDTLTSFMTFSPRPVLSFLIFALIFLAFAAVFAVLVSVSVGALVSGIKKIEAGGDNDFIIGLKNGIRHFPSVLPILLIQKVFIGAAFLISMSNLLILLRSSDLVSTFMYGVGFIVLTLLAISVSLVGIFAVMATVNKKISLKESIRHGWDMLTEHWLVSIEMSIALLVASIAITAVAILGVLILSVPLIFFLFIAAISGASSVVVGILTFTALLIIAALLTTAAFTTTFQTAAWVFLWQDMTERAPVAKLHRIAAHFKNA